MDKLFNPISHLGWLRQVREARLSTHTPHVGCSWSGGPQQCIVGRQAGPEVPTPGRLLSLSEGTEEEEGDKCTH